MMNTYNQQLERILDFVEAHGNFSDKLAAAEVRQAAHAQEGAKAEHRLQEAGVFKGEEGLRGLSEADEFWRQQPYGGRLYYGDGAADYLHRGVLNTAVKLLDSQSLPSAPVPERPTDMIGFDQKNNVF